MGTFKTAPRHRLETLTMRHLDIIITSALPASFFQGTTTKAIALLAASTLGTWDKEVLTVPEENFEALCDILDKHKMRSYAY